MNIIYTVCNRSNLAHALALADSVLQHQPGSVFYIGLADSIAVDNLPEHARILPVSEVAIPGWEMMASEYFDFELLPACRPWFALELLKKHPECAQLTFLAPTVILRNNFETLLEPNREIYLTPNISAPLKPSAILDDKRILNAGMYHSGSWILKPSEKTLQMLHWWGERTIDRAKFDLCNGMNTDQLWLNYVPVWVPANQTIHDAGWHYGLNAVLNKSLTGSNNAYVVDGKPLVSLDFAGLDYFDPIWSDHVELLEKNQAFGTLFREYRSLVGKKKQLYPVNGQPAFGKVAEISKYRISRNRIASKLKALNTFIDQF